MGHSVGVLGENQGAEDWVVESVSPGPVRKNCMGDWKEGPQRPRETGSSPHLASCPGPTLSGNPGPHLLAAELLPSRSGLAWGRQDPGQQHLRLPLWLGTADAETQGVSTQAGLEMEAILGLLRPHSSLGATTIQLTPPRRNTKCLGREGGRELWAWAGSGMALGIFLVCQMHIEGQMVSLLSHLGAAGAEPVGNSQVGPDGGGSLGIRKGFLVGVAAQPPASSHIAPLPPAALPPCSSASRKAFTTLLLHLQADPLA